MTQWNDSKGHNVFDYKRIQRLDLEMNNTCFLYCGGCGRTFNPNIEKAGKQIITLENIKKFFPPEFCKQLRYFLSCGNYGDPTAHPDTLEILQYFRSNGTRNISFSTNGASRSPAWWAAVAATINGGPLGWEGGRVTFSIDGLEDTNHMYKVGAKWDRIMENVSAFIQAGGRARWQFIIMNHNEHQIEKAKQLAKELGFAEFIEKVSFRFVPMRISKRDAETLSANAEFEMLKTQTKDSSVTTTFDETVLNNVNAHGKKLGVIESPVNVATDSKNQHPFRKELKMFHGDSNTRAKFFNKTYNIICQNRASPRIYVSADGKVWPCNWWGGIEYAENKHEFWPPPQFEKYNIPENFNSLYSVSDCENPVNEILSHPFYTHLLEQDWNSGDQPLRCKQMCHTELGKGVFEAMRRNEQNLKTGEYSDLSAIHGLSKDQNCTGIGEGAVVPLKGKTGFFDGN